MFPQSRLRRLLPYLGERYQPNDIDRPSVEGRDYDPGGIDRFNKQSGYLQRMFPTAGEALENEQTPIGGSSTNLPMAALRAIQPVEPPQTTAPINPQWLNIQGSLSAPTSNDNPVLIRPPTAPDIEATLPEPSGMNKLRALPPTLPTVRQDPQEARQEREDMLRDPHMAQPSHHRFRDALKLAGLGALQGLAGTGSIGGAIGGALGGGTVGVFDSKAYPRIQAQRELGRLEAQDAVDYGRLKRSLDLQDQQSQIGLRNAQAKRAGQPEPDYSQPIETEQGWQVYDRNNPSAPPRPSPITPRSKPTGQHQVQTQRVTNPDGSETLLQYDPESKQWIPAPAATGGVVRSAPKEKKEKVDYKMSDGRVVRISPEAAASADAAKGRGADTDRREADRIAREDERRADTEAMHVATDNRSRAAAAHQALAKFRYWKAEALNTRDTSQADRDNAKQQMEQEWEKLQAFGDFFEFNDDVNWPEVKNVKSEVSVSQYMRDHPKTSRAAVVDAIREQGHVPVP